MQHSVLVIPKDKPTFNVILDIGMLAKFGTILDVGEKKIQIDWQKNCHKTTKYSGTSSTAYAKKQQ